MKHFYTCANNSLNQLKIRFKKIDFLNQSIESIHVINEFISNHNQNHDYFRITIYMLFNWIEIWLSSRVFLANTLFLSLFVLTALITVLWEHIYSNILLAHSSVCLAHSNICFKVIRITRQLKQQIIKWCTLPNQFHHIFSFP